MAFFAQRRKRGLQQICVHLSNFADERDEEKSFGETLQPNVSIHIIFLEAPERLMRL